MIGRRVQLARRAPLRRRRPLWSSRPVSGPDRLTCEVVLDRDAHSCVACGHGGGLHPHHRTPLGRGGSRDPQANAPVNLLSVCPACHDGIHTHPVLARQLGLLVARGTDPHLIPVLTAVRGLVFLTTDGWFADVADVEPDGLADFAGVAGVA